MELYGVRIFVSDIGAAARFYGETLGLAVAWDAGDAVGFAAGAGVLIVEQERDPALVGRFVGVSLMVEDIARRHRDLSERGVAFLGPPERQPWGGTLAHFRDPSGNVITLVE
ncbi:MAG: VOC family protein [Paracoccaceae bacterium]